MMAKRVTKIASVIAALHLIVLSFVFCKPPAKYFLITCVGTVVVWGTVFSLREQKRRAGIVTGLLLLLAFQQATFHFWRSEQAGFWWPLVQFLSLQYLVALRCGSSSG